MALRKIITEEDPLLRKQSREIGEITDRIRILAMDMWETMYEANGIGLAAPQVGVLRRLVVIDVALPAEEEDEGADGLLEGKKSEEDLSGEPEPEPESIKCVLINPEIIEVSEDTVISKEGCLSVPGMIGEVERPRQVKIRALDLEGNQFELEGEGLLAKALLHEIDHLNGIVYTDIAMSMEPVDPNPQAEEGGQGEQ